MEALDASVKLTWDDPGDASITKWQVCSKAASGTFADDDWEDISGSDATTTAHRVFALKGGSALSNATEYKFQARAVNASGDGVASSVMNAAPMAVPASRQALTLWHRTRAWC